MTDEREWIKSRPVESACRIPPSTGTRTFSMRWSKRDLKRFPLGPVLVFLGVFGGGLLWLILIGLRFDYLITEVYGGGGPGEAIWSLDPLFTIFAAIPGIILAFVGVIVSVQSSSEHLEEIKPKLSFQWLNLFYLGEICLLVTVVVSFIGFLGVSSLSAEVVRISAILMGAIVITCIIHMLSLVLRRSIGTQDSSKLQRISAILLTTELVILLSVVLGLRLYTWSFIRITTLVIMSSGFLGLLLITPQFLSLENKNGAEGEI
ncbi:MAG: hypothetical protein RTV31_13650 [Candidatus Thorarchaeota archaeon]